jgi:hypothetical protein
LLSNSSPFKNVGETERCLDRGKIDPSIETIVLALHKPSLRRSRQHIDARRLGIDQENARDRGDGLIFRQLSRAVWIDDTVPYLGAGIAIISRAATAKRPNPS